MTFDTSTATRTRILHTAIAGLLLTFGLAGQAAEDVGEAATNPVANLMSLRLQYQNSTVNNADSYTQAGLFQAVIPFQTESEAVPLWVTRWTLPYIQTADLPGVGKKEGVGDTAGLIFAVPNFGWKGHTIGIGASVGIPTGGDNEFVGSGQWQLGPAVVYLNTNTPKLQWGALVFQNWDVSQSRNDAADVSNFNFQPILTKHLDDGWYIGLPDLPQTYNFETDEWTFNIGGQVGRVFPWRGTPIQAFGAVYYNTNDDDDLVAPTEWTFKVNVSFLLPKG